MDKTFEFLLGETPECNEFRRMGDGKWMAYSIKQDSNGVDIRAEGYGIREALEELNKKLI